MSLTFPGPKFTDLGTQPISLSALVTNIGVWAENQNLGVTGAPTYKSSNKSSAYFWFLKKQKENFNEIVADEFKKNPDIPRFQDLRKYIIIFANIILRDYCDLSIGAQEVDYQSICEYDDNNTDLKNLVEIWAKEIDEKNFDKLTEIYVEIENVKYPIAFYSKDSEGLRIYPFNTINPVVRRELMGWDSSSSNYTMAALLEELDKRPMSARALYAALDDARYSLRMNNLLSAFSSWLSQKRPDVMRENGTAYAMEYGFVPVDNTMDQLNTIPIPKVPIISEIKKNLFSEQLLIIKSNTNVKNGEYGLCPVDNRAIGIQDEKAPNHAVVPPLSQELVRKIHDPGTGNELEFENCEVLKSDGKYHVTIHLLINGARCAFEKSYASGDVKKCNNFPLVSLLTQNKNSVDPVRIYRTNYESVTPISAVYLDGKMIDFGCSDDSFEQKFNQNLSDKITSVKQGEFYYFSISHHDSIVGRSFYCGYLFFARSGRSSLYQMASEASETTVIIDEENEIAKIAVIDPDTMENVTASNVYNDRLLFINKNGRNDLKGPSMCWGELNKTIFEDGNSFVLAPFSPYFAEMVAKKKIVIENDGAKLWNNGKNRVFSVKFNFGGRTQVAAPRTYTTDMQFSIPNPPFFYSVETIDKDTNKQGYEVVMVQNMGLTSTSQNDNTMDSNKLMFKMENHVIETSRFVHSNADPNQTIYIQIFGNTEAGEVYYGQISLRMLQYSRQAGFYALKDDSTNCAAILLIKDEGVSQPKRIITGKVFDDNLFLIAKEPSREIYAEYQAWRKSGFLVDVAEMSREQEGDGMEYEAVFPFSLKMLQNLKEGNLKQVPGSTIVKYNRETKRYDVSVQITKGADGDFESFTMSYNPNAVVKCDNLPFVVSLANKNAEKYIARFNNEKSSMIKDHIDGSRIVIEYINGDQRNKLEESGSMLQIEQDAVILRLSISRDVQCSCHVLYYADDPFRDGVYSVQSAITGTQHVLDYSETEKRVSKVDVFTDYIAWTTIFSTQFANGTEATIAKSGPQDDYRIYSIPITMNFTELMKKRGDVLKVADYSNVKYSTMLNDPNGGIKGDNDDLYVSINLTGLKGGPANITKVYPKEHVIELLNGLPTLTVFPYVNFVADASFGEEMTGKPLWQQYSYAKFTKVLDTPEKLVSSRDQAIGSRIDFFVNGNKIDFKSRSTKIMEAMDESERTEMKIATVTGWGKYIHMKYDGSADIAPPQPIDSRLDGQEFGCIIMKPAKERTVSADMKAIVGVDFGTRNSIIAVQPAGAQETSYPYHGKEELQQIIVPSMDEKAFRNFSNLSYIPHFVGRPVVGGVGCGKFASTVMTYSAVQNPNEMVNPYDLGFVPNVQGDVLRRIMENMGEAGAMGDGLGFYSDLKISTEMTNPNKVALMNRSVRTFIKSVMFHTILNCYRSGCGEIDIRFSVPSETYAKKMGVVWNEALTYINDFIPQAVRGMIHVGDYQTEAVALFEYLKNDLAGATGGMPTYSAITDGGDGTYDFTINKYENGTLTNPASFSLRYAGQQIMTDSVNAFYDYLVKCNNGFHNEGVRKPFREMWKTENAKPDDLKTLNDLVNKLSQYREKGAQDREKEKTLALMLIEQFGIDCDKMGNRSAKSLMETVNPQYVNFVRMIQYKFLFLFNVLGEQIRKNIKLERVIDTSFNIYLYGGTAQALAIAEPLCQGKIGIYQSHSEHLLMTKLIAAMLDFPQNVDGEDIILKFIPAMDSEKREIARGLIQMDPASMPKAGASGEIHIPALGTDDNTSSSGYGSNTGFEGFGDFEGFAGLGNGMISENPATPAGNQRDEKRPRKLEQFIADLTNILMERKVKFGQKEYVLDRCLQFMDEKKKPITLSAILNDPHVRNALAAELIVMWTAVCDENPDIDDSELLYQIYILKMVGVAIEAYLRK